MRPMDRLLVWLLRRFVRRGTLRFTTARGSVFSVGDGTGPLAAIRFMTKAAERGVLFDPELKLGESYVDGSLRVEEGTIADLLAIVLGQTNDGMPPGWARLQWWVRYFYRRLQQFNRPSRARRNVAHHYDLDGRLYSLFLDADRQYSLRLFRNPGPVARRRPDSPRSAISPQSSCSTTATACSTSAAAGAGLRSISPNSAVASHRHHAVGGAIAARVASARSKKT